MNLEEINEVKHQVWSHLQHLLGIVEELKKTKNVPLRIQTEEVRNFGRRGVTWILDQVIFCRSEVEYWKELCENSGF